MEKKIGHELGNVFFPGGFLIQNRLNRNFSSKRSQRVNNSVKENKTPDLAWVWPLSNDVGGLGAWPHLVALQESGGIPVHGGLLRSPYPTRNTATASPCPAVFCCGWQQSRLWQGWHTDVLPFPAVLSPRYSWEVQKEVCVQASG